MWGHQNQTLGRCVAQTASEWSRRACVGSKRSPPQASECFRNPSRFPTRASTSRRARRLAWRCAPSESCCRARQLESACLPLRALSCQSVATTLSCGRRRVRRTNLSLSLSLSRSGERVLREECSRARSALAVSLGDGTKRHRGGSSSL